MRAAFRVDASETIGGGHVMRCLALAEALRAAGAQTLFLCRDLPGAQIARIRAAGHAAAALAAPSGPPPPAAAEDPPHAAWLGVDWRADAEECRAALAADGPPDWLILDHYALDARWIAVVGPEAKAVAVLDDLDDRPLAGALLINQSRLDPTLSQPGPRRALVGPRYALLRPEFAERRAEALARRGGPGSARRVLISTGLMDVGGAAVESCAALAGSGLAIDLALSRAAPSAAAAEALAGPDVAVHFDSKEIAALMVAADLAVGAAGATSWERPALGLPSVCFTLADNQVEIAAGLTEAGAHRALGRPETIGRAALREAVLTLAADAPARAEMARRAAALCDGRGLARVVAALIEDRP